MKNVQYISVLDILKEKYSEYLIPNLIDFELFRTHDGMVVSRVTQADNDSGKHTYLMKTDYLISGPIEKLRDWFRQLSHGETFFNFDRVFEECPLEEGEVIEIED